MGHQIVSANEDRRQKWQPSLIISPGNLHLDGLHRQNISTKRLPNTQCASILYILRNTHPSLAPLLRQTSLSIGGHSREVSFAEMSPRSKIWENGRLKDSKGRLVLRNILRLSSRRRIHDLDRVDRNRIRAGNPDNEGGKYAVSKKAYYNPTTTMSSW